MIPNCFSARLGPRDNAPPTGQLTRCLDSIGIKFTVSIPNISNTFYVKGWCRNPGNSRSMWNNILGYPGSGKGARFGHLHEIRQYQRSGHDGRFQGLDRDQFFRVGGGPGDRQRGARSDIARAQRAEPQLRLPLPNEAMLQRPNCSSTQSPAIWTTRSR